MSGVRRRHQTTAALQGEGRIDGKGEEAEEAWGQEWVSGPGTGDSAAGGSGV